MKTLITVLSFFVTLIFSQSCTKEISLNPKASDIVRGARRPGYENLPKAYVTPFRPSRDGQVEYRCNYGGFTFKFGNYFAYPTTIYPYQSGQPHIPSYASIDGAQNPLISFKIAADGYSFTAVFGTIVGLPTNAYSSINAYQAAFDYFVTGEIDPNTNAPRQSTLPSFETYAAQNNYPNNDGLITIEGRFVLDHTSPTNVSIIDITYGPPIPVE